MFRGCRSFLHPAVASLCSVASHFPLKVAPPSLGSCHPRLVITPSRATGLIFFLLKWVWHGTFLLFVWSPPPRELQSHTTPLHGGCMTSWEAERGGGGQLPEAVQNHRTHPTTRTQGSVFFFCPGEPSEPTRLAPRHGGGTCTMEHRSSPSPRTTVSTKPEGRWGISQSAAFFSPGPLSRALIPLQRGLRIFCLFRPQTGLKMRMGRKLAVEFQVKTKLSLGQSAAFWGIFTVTTFCFDLVFPFDPQAHLPPLWKTPVVREG